MIPTDRPKIIAEYLAASGVTALCIVKHGKGFDVVVGRGSTVIVNVVSAYWLEKKLAAKTARLARKSISDTRDRMVAEKLLHAAAAMMGARLTPDNVVISRATFAAKRLQVYLDTMNKNGGLAEFNKEYKRRRKNAQARGESFISFGTASTRLRRVLIKLLIDKKQIGVDSFLFDEVFR